MRLDAHAVPEESLTAAAARGVLGIAGGAHVFVLETALQLGPAFAGIGRFGGAGRVLVVGDNGCLLAVLHG